MNMNSDDRYFYECMKLNKSRCYLKTGKRANDIYSAQMRANDIAICTFLVIFDNLRNEQYCLFLSAIHEQSLN
jgi:hypothetical protein